MNKIIDRIIKKAQVPELMEILVHRLSLPDLQSLLLEVYRRRAKSLVPRNVLEQYIQNRFVQSAQVSPRDILEFDGLAFSLLPPDFETVALSPVSPLGSVSVLATVDQNNTLTTIRNTEVCSDSTNVMALECARRRRTLLAEKRSVRQRIKLCNTHRLLRTQAFEEAATFPHFQLLGLCTAGRDEGSFLFETDSLIEHIDFYIRLMMNSENIGLKLENIQVKFIIFDGRMLEQIEARVMHPLSSEYSNGTFFVDQDCHDGEGYYEGIRFQIFARDPDGVDRFLADGGFTDWTQKLLSNRKERLLISGMGSERLLTCFK